MREPHAVLGVARTATAQEIRAAYRRLCLRYHPDKHGSADEALRELAEERFKEIQAAYESLVAGTRRSASVPSPPPPAQPAPPPARPSEPKAEELEAWQSIDRLIAERRWPEVIAVAKGAERVHGRALWILAAQGTAYEELGHFAEAAHVAGIAAEAYPQDGDIAAEHGRLLVRAGRWKEAIPELQRARRVLGDLSDLLALNAIAYERAGFSSHAEVLYRQVDRIDPSNEYVARRDAEAGITRGTHSGGPASAKSLGCGGFALTAFLFVIWLIAKSLR